MLAVRKGELVERRLSHSLGRGSGTDSMKLLFSSLMLVWWRMISVWVLSRSFDKEHNSQNVQWKGENYSNKGLYEMETTEVQVDDRRGTEGGKI